jgi:hypothetical protein
MRLPIAFLSACVTALTIAGCCTGEEAPPTVVFPHGAARIDGACAGAPVSRALGVTVDAPYTKGGLRRFRIVNRSGAPHEVRASYVVADSGPCEGAFVRSHKLGVEDAKTCEAPDARSLDPDGSIELRLPPHRERADDACTKIGLALHAEVDGHEECVELGAWIAYRPAEE